MDQHALPEIRLRPLAADQAIASLDTLNSQSASEAHHDKQELRTSAPIVVVAASENLQHRCLPAQDTSSTAYRVLVAAILSGSILLGLPLAYGVFQDHYSKHFPTSSIAQWIGVLSSGLAFLFAPAIAYCLFCKSLGGLVVTQGLLYGVGTALVDIPLLSLLNTWFLKRRGVAYGLLFAGADLMGIAYTFLLAHLLPAYGFKITMAVLVAITFCFGGLPILFLKVRQHDFNIPSSRKCSTSSADDSSSIISQLQSTKTAQHPNKRYYQRPIYYIFTIANVLQALAFYLPFIYLPSFTTGLGHSVDWSAFVLSAANLAQVFGEVGFGQLSDQFHVKYLVLLSTTVASISAFVLWGLFAAKSIAALLVFAFMFGCFGSGFLALWARMGTLFGERDAQMVFSTLCTGRGIGSIVSGPISSVLLSHSGRIISKVDFGAGKYAGVVLFVGACMASSAFVGVLGVLALSWEARGNHLKKKLNSEAGSTLSSEK
ncbi:hypothetical protein LTR70_001355 [Exophiala xenobiotica]|uniref:Major facilitator superfamily (MFS) profile domain-containing protein n=1 Tax=Lithohypha guttulata TaxID=1690604 RepID=A0ABR0KP55_9EURO|nr:hypothetical protein LTR24_000890 [Lithohypha guttulata]KAK5328034.1 hypothetical protein LTR70_001355 [Exophiala xenobiotica]